MQNQRASADRLRLLAHALCASSVAVLSGTLASPALAQDSTPAAASDVRDDEIEEVIVTGFRQSLEQALNIKKSFVGSVDAIVAEDIADFPDQNLAESLQRIPGITITRDSGEGRNISVRGLSGEFTRIRINGMEAIAATGGEGGPNRGRDFDFNVFASELFNSLVVHKTAEASIDEGSLGAVVDLNTGRPFNYDPGLTLALSAQGEYNDVTDDVGPRLTGLFAYHDPEGRWGASFSAAYSDGKTQQLGQNTVRWQQSSFRSVMGVTCADNPEDAGCAEVAGAFHPRIPRYGLIELERERIGLTGALQFAPTDRTTVSVDVLYSKLDASRAEKWLEVLFRGNEGGMDVTDYSIDSSTNNLTMMSVDNAWVRSENFKKAWTTEFLQYGLNLEHEFSDSIVGHALIGQSTSKLDFPYEQTFMYDNRAYDGYQYDYSNDRKPSLIYGGADVSDPSTFQLSEFRDRPTNTEHKFDTLSGDIDWELTPEYSVKFGASYKKFTFETEGYTRDNGVCAAGLFDCDLDDDGINDLYGVPATAELTELYSYPDGVGAGTTTAWAIPSLSGWGDYFGLENLPLSPDLGNIRSVEEKDTTAFVQLKGMTYLAEHDFMFDIGVRYARTDQTSTGYNSGVQVTVDRPYYDDWLPAANAAFYITPELIWRSAVAKVMTRPGLGSLTPGGSVDPFNFRVSYQNPYLDPTRAWAYDTSFEWYFAPEAILSLAFFYKDIDSRPISTERTGSYASTGLPTSLLNPTSPGGQCPECQDWTISQIDNGPGGNLKGLEVGFQMPFAVFTDSPLLGGFGVIGNYTYVDSKVDYTFSDETVSERLFGLSKNAYNATLYFEQEKFNARVSMAYRDDYITGTSGTNNRFEGYDDTLTFDASAGYSINDHFDVTFEALNLTDEYQNRWADIDAKRRYEWTHTGRIFKLGVKYQY